MRRYSLVRTSGFGRITLAPTLRVSSSGPLAVAVEKNTTLAAPAGQVLRLWLVSTGCASDGLCPWPCRHAWAWLRRRVYAPGTAVTSPQIETGHEETVCMELETEHT